MTDTEFEAVMTCCDPKPECWCETCRPITMQDMRMVLCPDCGNKRCPKATDHRNACTDSNAVGQKGSSWEQVKPWTGAETGTPQASRARENELPGMTVGFFVPGQPVAKGRPIAGRGFGGRVTLRTPGKTVAYEGLVAHACHAAMKGMAPMRGPLALEMKVGVQIPVSTAKKLRADMESGKVQPTKRPDLDNIVKGICDGMNGIAYGDDAQIVELKVRKVYAITPGVHVMVRITEGEPA